MANSDKLIGIFPNTNEGSGIFPEIRFVGSGNQPISLFVKDNNNLSISSSGTNDILLINQSGLVATRGDFTNSLRLNNVPVSISGHSHLSSDLSSIQFKTASSSEWNTTNPVLASGEPGWDTTSGIFKIGDGVNNWNSLSAINFKSNKGSFFVTSSNDIFVIDGGYTVGSLDIFLNGVKLSASGDYIANNGTSVVLSEPVPSGSLLEYSSLIPGIIGNYSLSTNGNNSSSISIVAGDNISISTSGSSYIISVSGSLGLTTEQVDDRIANLLVAGSGIGLDYNDDNNILTINSLSIGEEIRSDTVDNVNYIGRAPANSSENNNVWTIKKLIIDSNGIDILTLSAINVSWSDRLITTYF